MALEEKAKVCIMVVVFQQQSAGAYESRHSVTESWKLQQLNVCCVMLAPAGACTLLWKMRQKQTLARWQSEQGCSLQQVSEWVCHTCIALCFL